MKRIRNLAFFFLSCLAVVVAAAMLWLAQARAMTLVHPGRSLPTGTPSDLGIDRWETVRFASADGIELVGWFIPPADGGATLVLVHGLGGNRQALLRQAALLAEHGYGALLFDLRNHGESAGSVTTLGHDEPLDVYGALDYLATRPEVDTTRIGLIGESLGGATVLRAAAARPDVRLVVAQAAYTSIEDNIAEGVQRITGLPPFPFAPLIIWFGEREAGVSIYDIRPVDDIARLSPRPVLLMHGGRDDLIEPRNSDRLYDAAGEPKQLVVFEQAGHGALYQADPERFADALLPFLDTYLRDGAGAG